MKINNLGIGLSFTKHQKKEQTPFDRLFDIFKELGEEGFGEQFKEIFNIPK